MVEKEFNIALKSCDLELEVTMAPIIPLIDLHIFVVRVTRLIEWHLSHNGLVGLHLNNIVDNSLGSIHDQTEVGLFVLK